MVERATAADIPPQLFADIVRYVFTDASRYSVRHRQPYMSSCALVCVHWAQQSRQRMYLDKQIHIGTRRQAEKIRAVVICTSSKKLTVVELISTIESSVMLVTVTILELGSIFSAHSSPAYLCTSFGRSKYGDRSILTIFRTLWRSSVRPSTGASRNHSLPSSCRIAGS